MNYLDSDEPPLFSTFYSCHLFHWFPFFWINVLFRVNILWRPYCVSVHVCVCAYMCARIHVYMCAYMCAHICMYVYMYVHMCVLPPAYGDCFLTCFINFGCEPVLRYHLWHLSACWGWFVGKIIEDVFLDSFILLFCQVFLGYDQSRTIEFCTWKHGNLLYFLG